MDPEVNQAVVMETTQPEMKMKKPMTLPSQPSFDHTITQFYNACLLAFK
jgi:hypothetical protein